MAHFFIATEDRLSETVAELLVKATGHSVAAKIPKDRRQHAGFGYLKARLPDFMASCRGGVNFFLLTDLDTRPCPPDLLQDWLGSAKKPDSLLLRIAVREVESWVLADRSQFAAWLGVSENLVPVAPEACFDPKTDLLKVVARSKDRELRAGLLPKKNAVSNVGLEYNDLLSAFVTEKWRIEEASKLAPSLERALVRLREFC